MQLRLRYLDGLRTVSTRFMRSADTVNNDVYSFYCLLSIISFILFCSVCIIFAQTILYIIYPVLFKLPLNFGWFSIATMQRLFIVLVALFVAV